MCLTLDQLLRSRQIKFPLRVMSKDYWLGPTVCIVLVSV